MPGAISEFHDRGIFAPEQAENGASAGPVAAAKYPRFPPGETERGHEPNVDLKIADMKQAPMVPGGECGHCLSVGYLPPESR